MLKSEKSSIAEWHRQQILSFRKESAVLSRLLKEHSVIEVLYGGTMASQSGRTPVMIAPIRCRKKRTVRDLIDGPTPYAILYTTGNLKILRTRQMLKAGAYLLIFQSEKRGWATHILDAAGHTAATVTTDEVAFERGKKDDLVEKAKKLASKKGFDIEVVDIEVEFNGSTEVFVSFLFWRWSLFKDPPLPYL